MATKSSKYWESRFTRIEEAELKKGQKYYYELEKQYKQASAAFFIKSIKQGRHGIEIELYPKDKSLELLGRHLGMFKDRVEISGQVNNPMEGLTTEELKKLINDG